MKLLPIATLRVLHLDELIEGAVRVEIDCPGSTTGYTSVPGAALSMSLRHLITMACFTHEEACGLCNTSEARKQGDQDAEAQVSELRAALQAVELRRYADESKN